MRYKAVVVFDFEEVTDSVTKEELELTVMAVLFPTIKGQLAIDKGSVGVEVYPL